MLFYGFFISLLKYEPKHKLYFFIFYHREDLRKIELRKWMNRKKAQRNREYMKKVNEMRGKEHNPFKSSGKMLKSQEIKRLNDFRESKKRLQFFFYN